MKTKHLSLRVSETDHAAIQAAAEAAGRTVSEHLRKSAISSEAVTVPELNRRAWQELAPAVANLNQLARAANRFLIVLRDASPSSTASQIVDLMNATRSTVIELRDDIQKVRRSLYGASPLEMAADLLDDYRRAASFGRLDVEAERLQVVADELRQIAEALDEVPR